MSHAEPNHLRAGRYTRGFLPRVRVEGRPYFVTFRLAGTLPQEVIRQYEDEREALMAKAACGGHPLSWEDRQQLHELYSARVEAYLDAGHGDCWMRDERIANLVVSGLKFFDQRRHVLSAWVIMPNHVHAIVRPIEEHRLHEIVRSWKNYTARQANTLLERTGDAFWAREYYDHVVRDDDEKVSTMAYIHNNPVKAGLCCQPEEWKWSSAYGRPAR
jgi:REP element-mobilizing transposase RayT